MDIQTLIKVNRRPRKQTGTRIETPTAFHLRYYITTPDGSRKKVCVKLANKSDIYRNWDDVEPLIARELDNVNGQSYSPTGSLTLTEFVEQTYLPWCKENRAAVTADSYTRLWELRWKSHVGQTALVNLSTADVTRILTQYAKDGFSGRTLSHTKWFLSGVYEFAIAQGVVPSGCNPVFEAKWLCKVARPEKQTEYSLEQVLSMLRILEPLDPRAAVAVALAYFAALRPAEIRGLQWEDFTGNELHVRRAMWRDHVGETKTEDSAASVPVIEPLRGLLERFGVLVGKKGYILQNANHKPLSLDSLNTRLIAPALKKANIPWRGYYPGRRGISSLVTDTSKNALNSTGLLRHSTPITALRHYTRAQKESIAAALKTVEEMATKTETIQ
jgi:integrase